MNHLLDVALVAAAVLIAAAYVIYALGPKRIKNFYSRIATKYFGLRAAHWFAGTNEGSCNNCQSNAQHNKRLS